MLKLCLIIVSVASSCYGGESNDQWQPCDLLIKTYDTLYNSLATTVEDASKKQERIFSIVLTGIFYYVAGDGNSDVTVDVSQTADVIAAETRSQLDVVRAALAPAIDMVKKSCRKETPQKQCDSALTSEVQKETDKCSNFPEVYKFFKLTEEMFSDDEFQKLISEVVTFSKTAKDDNEAIDYLKTITSGQKFKGASAKLVQWYSAYSNSELTCNLPPVECNSDDDICNL